MSKNWLWIVKFGIVIIAALVLGAVLGNLGLFKTATLGTPKLTAGSLAQFISHGAALALLWLLGQRAAQQLRASGPGLARLSTTVQALVTLIVIISAYVVLLQFIGPFVAAVKPFIDWAFILAILAAAGWLVWALYKDSEAVIEAVGNAMKSKQTST